MCAYVGGCVCLPLRGKHLPLRGKHTLRVFASQRQSVKRKVASTSVAPEGCCNNFFFNLRVFIKE